MREFIALLKLNLRHRLTDGFAVGYNIIFPAIMIGLLGVLTRNLNHGSISSYAYYTVVTIPFCIVMAVITAAYAAKDDAYASTAERVLLTPVSIPSLVLVKIVSCTLVFFLCSIVTYTIFAVILGLGLRHAGAIAVLYLSLSFAVSAVGSFIGFGMKNFMTIKNIINLPICLFAIAGGVFFPLGTFHRVGKIVLNMSPFTWINRSLFLMLYDERINSAVITGIVTIMTGLVFTVLAIATFKKGAYCDGCISGYEK